jgi:hypothetical protein
LGINQHHQKPVCRLVEAVRFLQDGRGVCLRSGGVGVNQAEWKDVVSLVVSLIGRQPVPMQIFSWLLVAFLVLMLIEGLRATFLPRRVVAQIRRRGSLGHEIAIPRHKHAETERVSAVPSPLRSGLAVPASVRNAKRADRTVNRREATRPKIRRMSSYFEYAGAPPEPLAPQIEPAAHDPVLGEV